MKRLLGAASVLVVLVCFAPLLTNQLVQAQTPKDYYWYCFATVERGHAKPLFVVTDVFKGEENVGGREKLYVDEFGTWAVAHAKSDGRGVGKTCNGGNQDREFMEKRRNETIARYEKSDSSLVYVIDTVQWRPGQTATN